MADAQEMFRAFARLVAVEVVAIMRTPNVAAPALLSRAEIARRCGVSLVTIDRAVRSGCPHVKVGRRTLLDLAAVRGWLADHGRTVRAAAVDDVDTTQIESALVAPRRVRRAS